RLTAGRLGVVHEQNCTRNGLIQTSVSVARCARRWADASSDGDGVEAHVVEDVSTLAPGDLVGDLGHEGILQRLGQGTQMVPEDDSAREVAEVVAITEGLWRRIEPCVNLAEACLLETGAGLLGTVKEPPQGPAFEVLSEGLASRDDVGRSHELGEVS